jgi:hypothetical protein
MCPATMEVNNLTFPVMDFGMDYSMAAAIRSGFSTSSASLSQQLGYTCSSGNCTWPSYRTLGVRSSCVDVTSQLKMTQKAGYSMYRLLFNSGSGVVAENITEFTLPDGNYINNIQGSHVMKVSLLLAKAL